MRVSDRSRPIHHLRLNMYIAQVRNGALQVVRNLGSIDPKEQMIGALAG